MMQQNQEVYGKLFDTAACEMKKAEKQIDCTSKAFVATIGSAPRQIDVKAFEHLSGRDYLNAVWFTCFQRLPSIEQQKTMEKMTKEEILRTTAKEGAFAIRKLSFVNCPYSKVKPGIKGRVLACASVVKNSVWLRKLAKKMPEGLQNKIRGLFS